MNSRIGLLMAIGLWASGLCAQDVPRQFVVDVEAARKIHDSQTINLATAERLAETCQRMAVTQQVRHSIMVLDRAGTPVYFDRMDGQGYLNTFTAEMKARTALLTGQPSKRAMNAVSADPALEFENMQLGLYSNSGGLPILVNGQILGAIGVGGTPPQLPRWSDEICAHRAMREVLGASVPPLVEDVPPRPAPAAGTAPVPRFAPAAPPRSSLPAEYVVNAAAAVTVLDGNQISLAAAKKVARTCRDWVTAKGAGMSVYVLNAFGELVHMERMDGQTAIDVRAALLKAQSALKLRQPTSIRAAQFSNNPGGLPVSSVWFDFFTDAGGIPIVIDGQMIGAVGVSGSGGAGDEACAVEGLKAAFGTHATLPVYP
ncbi:MAG: heme-binding protein [Steroidobacteraceae bacterium]